MTDNIPEVEDLKSTMWIEDGKHLLRSRKRERTVACDISFDCNHELEQYRADADRATSPHNPPYKYHPSRTRSDNRSVAQQTPRYVVQLLRVFSIKVTISNAFLDVSSEAT